MAPVNLIDTPGELEKLVRLLHDQDFVAVDTEFLRERTYYPRLCLIQVATPTTIACVDALALEDLSPLTSVLLDTTITKVLHSARQDYEIFVRLTGVAPAPLFDTQIAADLCGIGDQGGFATVVSRLLSVVLDKSHTRTDWSRRPLSEEQLKYAADDVRYLIPIYEILLEQLEKNGRKDWQSEECGKLVDPALYVVDPALAWQRLRGLQGLSATQFHTARLLSQWREARAIAHDRPRGWVLRDDALMRIAKVMPATTHGLAAIESLPRPLIRKESEALLEIVEAGRHCDETVPELPEALTSQQRKRVRKMMNYVRDVAAEVGVSAATLASRRDIVALVRQSDDAAVLSGWRREIIGDRLLAITDETV